jgi:hypothetical protein
VNVKRDNNRLRVGIAEPGTVSRGSRFDRSGLITAVELDGAYRFCRPEDPDPSRGTGGIGLCGEFGIEEPIDWDEAAPGEHFPKLGVGLLQ